MYMHPRTSTNSKEDKVKEIHVCHNKTVKRQREILESRNRKMTHHLHGTLIRLTADFSSQITEVAWCGGNQDCRGLRVAGP
jgi:hypothetical protein